MERGFFVAVMLLVQVKGRCWGNGVALLLGALSGGDYAGIHGDPY